jgi:tripartite-type tricarboxylate transporter receptor subunit TctC
MIKKFLMALLMAFSSMAMASQIEIVVPVAPGGAVDMSARGLSQALTKAGYDNIVVYKPGGNNEIARNYVIDKKDNVVFVGSTATFVFSNIVLEKDNQYVKDLNLYGPSLINSMAFYVPGDSKIKSLKDLVDSARDPKTPLVCGVSNSHGEILLLSINNKYGTNFKPVPYKGTGQMLPDLMGSHIPCAFDQTAPYVKIGDRVRWLAVSGKSSRRDVPYISTILKDFRFENWYAAAIVKNGNLANDKKLINILSNWSQDVELVKPLLEQDFVVSAPDDLNTRAKKETEQYRGRK